MIVWDQVGDRVYESGLDRGVLYLPDGSAVPWNGLTSITEVFNKESSPVYFDGMKINDLVVPGEFAATMKAITYPDEFLELEGMGSPRPGVFVGDQPPQIFGLCYRTLIGNDTEGESVGYKLHIVYNLTATPSDKEHASLTNESSLEEFEWTITAIPEEIEGFRPTAHIVLDSRNIDPWLLEDLEDTLYGRVEEEAFQPSMPELFSYITAWYRIEITDNGDGTWTATSYNDNAIVLGDDEYFEISGVNAEYLDPETYEISTTIGLPEEP